MLEKITYFLIFGRPLIMYLGLLTFIALITTATLGLLVIKGKIKFKWHKAMAITLITLAIIHSTLGILLYF